MSWRSILQSTIALSTSEVEYMPMIEAIKEVFWPHGLIKDFGISRSMILKFNITRSSI